MLHRTVIDACIAIKDTDAIDLDRCVRYVFVASM
jgi:hypothetical protein